MGSLVAAGIGPTQARAFVEPLLQACAEFAIDRPQRQAAFVAQAAHESTMFVHLEEDLYYRDPARVLSIFRNEVASLTQAKTLVGNPRALANIVYANRNGNGPPSTGDGWTYRGRGFGLTGRANYTAAALAVHRPYIDQPELVALPLDACLSFGWFWDRARCNGLADASDIDGITRAINGSGMAGADERRKLYPRFLQAFR